MSEWINHDDIQRYMLSVVGYMYNLKVLEIAFCDHYLSNV